MSTDEQVRNAYFDEVIKKHLPFDDFKRKFKINDEFDEDDYTYYFETNMTDFNIYSYEEFVESLEDYEGSTSLDEEEYNELMQSVSLEIGDLFLFADEFDDEFEDE